MHYFLFLRQSYKYEIILWLIWHMKPSYFTKDIENLMSKLDTFLFFPQPSCKFNSMILRNIAVCSVCWVFCISIYSLHSFNLNNSNQHVRDVISVIYWRLKWLLISLSMSKEFVTFKLYSKVLFKLDRICERLLSQYIRFYFILKHLSSIYLMVENVFLSLTWDIERCF